MSKLSEQLFLVYKEPVRVTAELTYTVDIKAICLNCGNELESNIEEEACYSTSYDDHEIECEECGASTIIELDNLPSSEPEIDDVSCKDAKGENIKPNEHKVMINSLADARAFLKAYKGHERNINWCKDAVMLRKYRKLR